MKFGTCDGPAIYNLRTESTVEITKPIMQKSANRNYFTRWSHQGYVLDGYHPGDVAGGKHILPMQERHRPVAVGNTRSRLSCYGTARNQDRNPMQANHYLCNDTYMCCTSPRRCLLWPTQIGRWDYLIDQLLSLG